MIAPKEGREREQMQIFNCDSTFPLFQNYLNQRWCSPCLRRFIISFYTTIDDGKFFSRPSRDNIYPIVDVRSEIERIRSAVVGIAFKRVHVAISFTDLNPRSPLVISRSRGSKILRHNGSVPTQYFHFGLYRNKLRPVENSIERCTYKTIKNFCFLFYLFENNSNLVSWNNSNLVS